MIAAAILTLPNSLSVSTPKMILKIVSSFADIRAVKYACFAGHASHELHSKSVLQFYSFSYTLVMTQLPAAGSITMYNQ